MVGDVEPVSHLKAVAVDREGLAAEGVSDHEGDEFFWEVIRPIIVAAVGGEDG